MEIQVLPVCLYPRAKGRGSTSCYGLSGELLLTFHLGHSKTLRNSIAPTPPSLLKNPNYAPALKA